MAPTSSGRRKRIRYLFDVYPHVAVACSGGKDSTVTPFLAGAMA